MTGRHLSSTSNTTAKAWRTSCSASNSACRPTSACHTCPSCGEHIFPKSIEHAPLIRPSPLPPLRQLAPPQRLCVRGSDSSSGAVLAQASGSDGPQHGAHLAWLRKLSGCQGSAATADQVNARTLCPGAGLHCTPWRNGHDKRAQQAGGRTLVQEVVGPGIADAGRRRVVLARCGSSGALGILLDACARDLPLKPSRAAAPCPHRFHQTCQRLTCQGTPRRRLVPTCHYAKCVST